MSNNFEEAYEDLILYLMDNGIKNAYEKISQNDFEFVGTERVDGELFFIFEADTKPIKQELKKMMTIEREDKRGNYKYFISEDYIQIKIKR